MARQPPAYRLVPAHRLYACRGCACKQMVYTTHTGPVEGRCPGCYWRGSQDMAGNSFPPGDPRPMDYVGRALEPSDYMDPVKEGVKVP